MPWLRGVDIGGLAEVIGSNVLTSLGKLSRARTFPYSWLTSQDEEPFITLLQPSVNLLKNPLSSCM
jgi:hypothetical protein